MSDDGVVIPEEGEIWRHFKGGLYVIVCRAVNEYDHEVMVVYRRPGGEIWARSLRAWSEEIVDDSGKWVPRFTRLEPGA